MYKNCMHASKYFTSPWFSMCDMSVYIYICASRSCSHTCLISKSLPSVVVAFCRDPTQVTKDTASKPCCWHRANSASCVHSMVSWGGPWVFWRRFQIIEANSSQADDFLIISVEIEIIGISNRFNMMVLCTNMIDSIYIYIYMYTPIFNMIEIIGMIS